MKKALANSELAIMELLWQSDKLTAREIREALYADSRKSQHGTVQKLLQRLEEKEYIIRDSSQYTQQFEANISREEYAGEQMEYLTSRLTSGSIAPLITHLLKKEKISPAEINEIMKLLDNYKGEKDASDK